jgi:hypothetical protein
MSERTMVALSVAAMTMAATAVLAQNSPPSYEADPDVYKVIFEDQNFRVIAATWKNGVTDKPHSHPLPSVVYPLTDCVIRLHNPDGTTRDVPSKAGIAFAAPITASHRAENISGSDCRGIFVERK